MLALSLVALMQGPPEAVPKEPPQLDRRVQQLIEERVDRRVEALFTGDRFTSVLKAAAQAAVLYVFWTLYGQYFWYAVAVYVVLTAFIAGIVVKLNDRLRVSPGP